MVRGHVARVVFAFVSVGLMASFVACADVVEGTGDPNRPGGASSGPSGSNSGSYEDPGGIGARRSPPVIASVSPLAGDYGTEVTITGDNFDGATLSLAGPVDPVLLTVPGSGNEESPAKVVTKWSKTEIRFRYPFPADGAVRVTSPSGQAEGGIFVPSWRPGTGVAGAFDHRTLLGVVSPAPGAIVAAFDGPRGALLVVARPDGSIATRPFDRGASALSTMSLFLDGAGGFAGAFASGGTLWTLSGTLESAVTTDTRVTATFAAGGRDASGSYAWIKNGTTLSRVRAPGWTVETTLSDPTPASAPGPSIAVGSDDSLIVGWGVNGSSGFPFYDHTTRAVASRLRPGQATFDPAKTVGGGADDYMVWTRFRGGPEGRVASYFCANDTGLFSSPSLSCRQGYVGSGVLVPSSTEFSSYLVGWNATTSIAASCEVATGKLLVGPETQTSAQVPTLYPCPPVVGLTADPDGNGIFLAQGGKLLYAPRKR